MVSEESDSESLEESADEFPVVEIRSKTLEDEREIFKETFNKLIKEKKVKDGESIRGRSVQEISNSQASHSRNWLISCTIKWSNFLESALTDLQFPRDNYNLPTRVVGNFCEVFSFNFNVTNYYSFLCSFAISEVLRLTIFCGIEWAGQIGFGIGFTPADVPVKYTFNNASRKMPPAPDFWMMEASKIPLELFVTHGNLLVRGHMTSSPRSIVHVEIMELLHISWPISVVRGKKHLTVGKRFDLNQSTNKGSSLSGSGGKSGRFSCLVEFANCLNVSLRNRNNGNSNYNDKNFWPPEIQSFHRESFLGSSDTNLEAMFCYEILSTDLTLSIALQVGPGTNSFAAAFSQIPVGSGKNEMEALMNPSQWKIHDYKKYSNASTISEIIRDRNIRAKILMTKEEKSILKIRIYAV